MKCPQCNAENAEGKNFCSDCGSLLTPQLLPLIRSQVEEYVREHFKDKTLVEIEASEAVAGRVLKWARLYYAVPVAVLIVILALFGISDYSDFHKTIHRATDELTPKLNHAIAGADAATNKAQAAETKSDEAIKAIDAATTKMNAQLASAQQLAAKVSGLESKTTTQISDASKHVEGRVTELDKSVESANKAIAEQQKKLINTNELVTLFYSKGEVETFTAAQGNSANFAVYAVPPPTNNAQKGAVVFMLLKSAPIFKPYRSISEFTFNQKVPILFAEILLNSFGVTRLKTSNNGRWKYPTCLIPHTRELFIQSCLSRTAIFLQMSNKSSDALF